MSYRNETIPGIPNLPPRWEVRLLKDIVCSTRQITYGIVKAGDHTEGGIFLVRACDYSSGWVHSDKLFRVSSDIESQYRRSRIREGDILLTLVGSVGNVARVPPELNNANVTRQTARIAIGDQLGNPEFVYNFLRSAFLRRQIYESVKLGAQPALTLDDVQKFRIPHPPLPEQRKIAAILSTWDRAIELTEKLIAAKQKRKQALMQQLLTGKVRFKEFVESKTRQETPLGEMPSDWKEYRFSKIIEKVKRKNTIGESHVLTASGEFGLVDQREFFNRSVAGADLSGYYLLRNGEFAYNRSAMKGYPYGAIKRLDRYTQGVLSTLYICFGISSEDCDSNFLCHFFEARFLDRQLRGITQVGGRAHGLLNITDSDFYSMKVVLPSIEEQQSIAAVLDVQDVEINHLRKKFDSLKQQKKGLMQQLLTGKVRVNIDLKESAT